MAQPMTQSAVRYDAHEHLAVLRDLCAEVEAATTALAGCRLHELREHVLRQSALCVCLEEAVRGLVLHNDSGKQQSLTAESSMAEIRSTHIQLLGLNRRFAFLLRRSRRTAELLSGHYRAFLDGFGRERTLSSWPDRWNSEM